MSTLRTIVKYADLEWIGELSYAVGHGPHLAPGEPAAERNSFSDEAHVRRVREAIRRLNPTIPQSRTLITLHNTLLPRLLGAVTDVSK